MYTESLLLTWIDSHMWVKLWPELSLALIGLVTLMGGAFANAQDQRRLYGGSLFLGAVVVGLLFTSFTGSAGEEELFFAGMLRQDGWTQSMRLLLASAGVLTCFLGWQQVKGRQDLPRMEYAFFTYISTAALMLLSQAQHFLMLFVALETAALGFILMIAYERGREHSLEAGIKYLVLAGLSTALMLFGLALLYGLVGNPELNPILAKNGADPLAFESLHVFLSQNSHLLLARAGVLMLLIGVFFKIGLVPFQIWVPDVYAGAPTPTAAFLAVASKAAGFFMLIRLLFEPGPLEPMAAFLLPILVILTTLTLLVSNLAALRQRNVQRLMGLSGVAHAGYLMLGMLAALHDPEALPLVMTYLIAYFLASFCVFGVIQALGAARTEDYRSCLKTHPLLAGVLVVGLGSLAGIPPLLGFTAKALLFIAAAQAQLYPLLGVAALGVILSIYYYFSWIREAFFETLQLDASGPESSVAVSLPFNTMLLLLALATLLLGLIPAPLF